MSFLDKEGLTKYTNKILDRISNVNAGVTSFNGRTGAISPASGDYSVSQVTGAAPKASPVFTGSISLGRKSGTTVGNYSFAVGYNVTASGAYSHAEGWGSIAYGARSHAEGSEVNASNDHAHAEGVGSNAAGLYSHAEGYSSVASGIASHAENNSVASGSYSHSEGVGTNASGERSHTEGTQTNASGNYSHAEGQGSHASGVGSHAEGNSTVASGDYSHAEGAENTASNYASHACGKYAKAMTDGGAYNNTTGDVFVVGNGVSPNASYHANAFRIAYNGTIYAKSQYMSTGADYAEYFEWLDGNPNNEDRVGHFVTLEGTKIKLAQPGDYILGVVSGQPCVIGNADEDWLGRWEHDDFNRFVKEYLVDTETEVFPPLDLSEDELPLWLSANEVIQRGSQYFKMESQVVDYPTPSWRHKANPSYDSSIPYVERQDRKEWDAIGMVGVLSVIDDGTCQPNSLCTFSADGIATHSSKRILDETWRVIERVNNHVVKIIFR